MSSKDIHPNQILEALLSKGVRRDKQEKLKKLNELCSLEYKRHSQGARDLSLANMSKAAEIHGLFKARTIYNAQSEDYVTLITAWEKYNGPKESKNIIEKTAVAEKYEFLKKIEDPAIRSLCQIAFAERDRLKAELNLLKSKTQVVVDMRPLGAETLRGKNDIAILEPVARLTDSEKNSLINAISTQFLDVRKWRIGDAGEILDDRGRFVFLPGFATAIRKIIDH
jgi:hypothetical protein